MGYRERRGKNRFEGRGKCRERPRCKDKEKEKCREGREVFRWGKGEWGGTDGL